MGNQTPRKLTDKELRDGLEAFIQYHGGVHDDDCPEDDTCDCSGKLLNESANAVFDRLDRLSLLESLLTEVAKLEPEESAGAFCFFCGNDCDDHLSDCFYVRLRQAVQP